MKNSNLSGSFDDLVYEEEYYKTYYDAENLEESDALDKTKDTKGPENNPEADNNDMNIMHICEECNHNWEADDNELSDQNDTIFCPQCGSVNIVNI